MVVQIAEGRSIAKDDAARVEAFQSMLVYSGPYRIEGFDPGASGLAAHQRGDVRRGRAREALQIVAAFEH